MINRFFTYLKQLGLYLYQQALAQLIKLIVSAATLTVSTATLTKLTIEKQYKVNVGRPEQVIILLVGCGGTGGYVAHILAQLANWSKSNGLDTRLYFVDPDKVEEKNLVRQNFCRAEIGYPKAFTLAWRYTAAFGLTITPLVERFSAELLQRYTPSFSPQGTLTIVIGAVDNVCARRDIAAAITARLKQQGDSRDKLWWIDAGNERMSGQILAGNSLEPEPLLSPLGYCTGLPLPHLQEPSLLLDRERPPIDLSCAELTLLEEQSAMINRTMAAWVGVYLYRLLQSRDLNTMSTFVNLAAGETRSTPITGGRIVKPERSQRSVPIRTVEADPHDVVTCPDCSGEIIEGQDEWYGILIAVRFCAECTWREEVCPNCGEEICEDEFDVEGNGEFVPVIYCRDGCDWQAPIPPAYRNQPRPTPLISLQDELPADREAWPEVDVVRGGADGHP